MTRAAPEGPLLGLLGGGAAGGILSGGLGDLLKQFQQNGQGDKAQSWIASGPNKAVSPRELAEALGPDKIAWLMQQTGQRRGWSRPLRSHAQRLSASCASLHTLSDAPNPSAAFPEYDSGSPERSACRMNPNRLLALSSKSPGMSSVP